jgi:hypothetical protein
MLGYKQIIVTFATKEVKKLFYVAAEEYLGEYAS